MSKAFWLESRATIVLLPSAEEGVELFELAKNWAEVGLLGPALWVTPESVTFPENEPVLVTAKVLGNDRDGQPLLVEVDLFEQLARENLSIIRLVKVRSLTPKREFDETQNRIAKTVEEALQSVIPSRDVRDNRNSHTSFQVTNLIAAPSSHSVEQRLKWELHSGNVTVVASPEDRSSPWSTDAFIRSGDRFVGFVLMHLATVGGLWNGLPVGTLELFEREESGGEQVWISRVFVSSVLTDGLARRVAAQVLEDAANADNGTDTPPAGCAFIEDDVRDEYIDSMVNYMMTLDEAVLSYRRPPQLEDPEKIDISIPAQVVDYFVFAANKTIRIPYWAYRFVRGKVAGFIEGKLQGDDGLAQVEMNLRREALDYHDRTLLDRELALADREREARKATSAPIRLSEIRSTPSLWASIREMVFGSLDGGSDLSNKGFPLVNTRTKPIFRSASQLFPDPEGTYALPDGVKLPKGSPSSIGWDNYGEAMGLSRTLSAWQQESAAKTDEHNTRLAEYSSELSKANKRVAEITEELDRADALSTNAKGDIVPITIEEARTRRGEKAEKSGSPVQEATGSDVQPEADSTEAEGQPVSPENDPSRDEAARGSQSTQDAESGGTEPDESPNPEGSSLVQGLRAALTTGSKDVVLAPEDSEAEPETHSEPLDLEGLIREYKALTKRVNELGRLISESEEASRGSQEKEAERAAVSEEFSKWQSSNERSLLWKFRLRLTDSLATAESDLAKFKAALEEVEPHEPGTLAKLRKAFHKSLLVTHGIVWLVAGVVAGLGWSVYSAGNSGAEQSQIQILQSQQILEAQNPLQGSPTRSTYGSFYDNAAEIQQATRGAFDSAFAAYEADPDNIEIQEQLLEAERLANEAEVYLSALEGLATAWQAQDLGREILTLVAIGAPSVLVVTLLALLIPYYRQWTGFRRQVDIQLTNLERIQKGNQVSRSEIERMKALHGQTIDWLKILAMSAHTPWEVRPSWLESGLKTLQLDALPFAMRVAQAHDGDHASFSTLIDSANQRLAQPGWRQRAFEGLVDEIAQSTGKSPKMFSLDTLDRDLPHATNNSRSHLLKHMRHSDYLQRVAVQYLKPLIEDLQGKAMAMARPEVFQVERDALEELKGDIEGIDEYRKYESWDNFLSHTLTLSNGKPDPVTALSVMAIAPEKIMDGEHEQVMSYALLPEHVHQKLDHPNVAGVIMRTYDSKTARPLDSVIRVDLVGPISFNSVRLVSKASAESPSNEDEIEEVTTRVRGAAV